VKRRSTFVWSLCYEEGSWFATLAVTKDGREYHEPFPLWLLLGGEHMDLCFKELEICWVAERDAELWRLG
jgi:hypothetical protein